MKRARVLSALLVAVAACLAAAPALAEGMDDVEIFYSSRMRYENLNNYMDFRDHDGSEWNDRAAFWSMRNNLGVRAKVADGVRFLVDVQNVGAFGSNDPFRSEFEPLLQNTPRTGSEFGDQRSDTSIYRAIISLDEIGGTGFSVDVGRQEFVLGDGLIMGNEPFYGGTVFDGIHGRYEGEGWKAGAFCFTTYERNDPGSLFYDTVDPGGSDDQRLFGGYADFALGEGRGRHTLQAYAIARDDNFEGSFLMEDQTLGAVWSRRVGSVEEAEANPMSWKAELAYQMGEQLALADPNEVADTDGFIFEGWFGWSFISGSTVHGPFAGGLYAPGDGDPGNTDEITIFRPLFPTVHNRIGQSDVFSFTELTGLGLGINAYQVGYRVAGGEAARHRGEVVYWSVAGDEDEVTLGMTTIELHDVGTEIDLVYDFAYRENVHLFATVAQFSPSDDLADLNPTGGDDPVTRLYGGFRIQSK